MSVFFPFSIKSINLQPSLKSIDSNLFHTKQLDISNCFSEYLNVINLVMVVNVWHWTF